MVDGKFNQNISILLSLRSYLVILQHAEASSNLIYNFALHFTSYLSNARSKILFKNNKKR